MPLQGVFDRVTKGVTDRVRRDVENDANRRAHGALDNINVGETVNNVRDRISRLGSDRETRKAIKGLEEGDINLSRQPDMARAVQGSLNALSEKLGNPDMSAGAVDGQPGRGTLSAINTFLESQGMDQIGSIRDFGKDELLAVFKAVDKANVENENVLKGQITSAMETEVLPQAAEKHSYNEAVPVDPSMPQAG